MGTDGHYDGRVLVGLNQHREIATFHQHSIFFYFSMSCTTCRLHIIFTNLSVIGKIKINVKPDKSGLLFNMWL